MVESSAQDLTSTNYWETFWSDGHRPSTIHKSGLRNHVQDTFLGVLAPLIEATGPRPRWIEAGCAYSKYLTALPDKFDIEMHGLDYESAALEATRAESGTLRVDERDPADAR